MADKKEKEYLHDNPQLMVDWDYDKNTSIDINTITCGSNKKAFWICLKCRNEWQAAIKSRNAGRGCPSCARKNQVVEHRKNLIKKNGSLAANNPALTKEWHPTKNGDLKPTDVSIGSNEKVWWLGKCGHEWVAVIKSRNAGNKCPYCSGKKVFVGLNDLFTINPSIVNEWHPTKNLNLKPIDVTVGSNKKVWWFCSECGNEWQATIKSRNAGRGCPICAKIYQSAKLRKTKIVKNGSLADNNPFLTKEWHPKKNGDLEPTDVSTGSGLKIWWLCSECGNEWQATINSRYNGRGCSICARKNQVVEHRKNLIKKNGSLATNNPALTKEWHPTKNGDIKPSDVSTGSKEKVWWLGKCGHEWLSTVNSRSTGYGCPFCSGRKIIIGENDLLTINPLLANEWHPIKNGELKPTDVTVGSNKKVWWQCRKGHEWKTAILYRSYGSGCPICSNELQTSFPEQTVKFYLSKFFKAESRYKIHGKEIDIYLPEINVGIEYDGIRYHTSEKSKLREAKKNEVFMEKGIKLYRIKESDINKVSKNIIFFIYNSNYSELPWAIMKLLQLLRVKENININISKDRQKIYELYIISEKEYSLATKNPKVSIEWNYKKNGKLKPEFVLSSSNKKVWWLCSKCGNEWQASISSRNLGRGCPICAYKTRVNSSTNTKLIKSGSLSLNNPELSLEWHPTKNGDLKPTDVSSGSGLKVWWLCSICGNEWQTMVGSRSNGHGCPYCSSIKSSISKTKNNILKSGSLFTNNSELSKEWHYKKNGNLKPTDVSSGSHKKVWWLGKCGHEWLAEIKSRNSGIGCPYCSGLKVYAGENDLLFTNPTLASEWHQIKNGGLKATDVTAGSSARVWWLGKCGHEWQAKIYSRNCGRGCPYCSGNLVTLGVNDLSTTNPSLASEWHPIKNGDLKPTDVSYGSHKIVWWICHKCGNEWQAEIKNRNSRRRCSNCYSLKKV